ncbi:uncharacterized protein LOC124934460 [Impatiens glandulifera]|uniref:uncharacterized protein LOC124934460 n=1 Tax=Impatiens glandulifera TaxID=253017 RepID=UPI001FB1801B|nr:uncharacterized protein LOC124934460 [Impatiens glandulifera]
MIAETSQTEEKELRGDRTRRLKSLNYRDYALIQEVLMAVKIQSFDSVLDWNLTNSVKAFLPNLEDLMSEECFEYIGEQIQTAGSKLQTKFNSLNNNITQICDVLMSLNESDSENLEVCLPTDEDFNAALVGDQEIITPVINREFTDFLFWLLDDQINEAQHNLVFEDGMVEDKDVSEDYKVEEDKDVSKYDHVSEDYKVEVDKDVSKYDHVSGDYKVEEDKDESKYDHASVDYKVEEDKDESKYDHVSEVYKVEEDKDESKYDHVSEDYKVEEDKDVSKYDHVSEDYKVEEDKDESKYDTEESEYDTAELSFDFDKSEYEAPIDDEDEDDLSWPWISDRNMANFHDNFDVEFRNKKLANEFKFFDENLVSNVEFAAERNLATELKLLNKNWSSNVLNNEFNFPAENWISNVPDNELYFLNENNELNILDENVVSNVEFQHRKLANEFNSLYEKNISDVEFQDRNLTNGFNFLDDNYVSDVKFPDRNLPNEFKFLDEDCVIVEEDDYQILN